MKTDSEIQRDVLDELKVEIEVLDGTVRLTGRVPSWAELNAVEGAVLGTAGVRKVDSRLRIRS